MLIRGWKALDNKVSIFLRLLRVSPWCIEFAFCASESVELELTVFIPDEKNLNLKLNAIISDEKS